jgi:hypothetical protein
MESLCLMSNEIPSGKFSYPVISDSNQQKKYVSEAKENVVITSEKKANGCGERNTYRNTE